MTSVPPEAVPEADLETAPDVDVAPKSPRWGERFRRLVPTRTVDTRSAIDRLRDAPPADVLRSWLLTIGLTALAFVVRFVGFWFPKGILFDETYYAKDAYTLLKLGYEGSWPENANDQIASGNVDVFTTNASFIVHPQVG